MLSKKGLENERIKYLIEKYMDKIRIIKYQLVEYKNERDCWLSKESWCRNFYSAKALKECFASEIEDHDILISYLGMKDIPNILKHAGLFNKLIAFVDNKTRKTYQFKKVEEMFKYRIEDIAECVIRLCDENDIFLSPRDVILYCHYIKRWYKEHGIDIMHEVIENRGGIPSKQKTGRQNWKQFFNIFIR